MTSKTRLSTFTSVGWKRLEASWSTSIWTRSQTWTSSGLRPSSRLRAPRGERTEESMMWNDNREFMEILRASGDLLVVTETVSWDLELGAISRLACEREAPAIWFARIADYPEEHTVFVNPLATWRRLAIALALGPEATVKEIYHEYERRESRLIPPVEVKTGPCKEIILRGDQVDLFQFPAPMLHEGDGGD